MTKEQAKQMVYNRFRQILKPDRSGKGYICPISGCTSGTGSHGTGITENPQNSQITSLARQVALKTLMHLKSQQSN